MARKLALLMVLAVILIVGVAAVPAHAARPGTWTHPASARLASGHGINAPTPPDAVYDEQIGETFTQSFSSLAYNVTALAQSDADGYGPAYLLNGLTDGGYWYQIGVSYDWPFIGGGYVPGFAINFEVFDSTGNSVFPASGGGGLDNFTGTVHSGDSLLLSLSFSGGQVDMKVRDWQTGATGLETYAAHGSSFVGLSAPADANGFFTGLMTEWYHVNQYLGGEGGVTYSNPTIALASAFMWADEFNANTNTMVFETSQQFTFTNPNQLLTFTTNGAVAQADAYRLITGSATAASITLSYSVSGGGSGYTGPTLNYVYNGSPQTATLTTTPTTYFMDRGTQWSATATLAGSSATQRWEATGTPGGAATADTTITIVYFQQFLLTFDYANGAGTGGPMVPAPSVPIVQYVQFGTTSTSQSSSSPPVWADAGSAYSYESPIMGSSPSERWATPTPSGTVLGPSSVKAVYFHQFAVALSFSLVGISGPSPTLPSVTGYQFGSLVTFHSVEQTLGNLVLWLDSGTGWNASNPLPGGGPQERWLSESVTHGSVIGGSSASISYYHQFSLTLGYSLSGGGSPAAPALSGFQFGKNYTASLTAGPTTYFLDAGSMWKIPATLPESTPSERWVTSQNQSTLVSGSSSLTAVYRHQYHVVAAFGPTTGGSISIATGWYDSGSTLQISALASAGWKFEGWSGNGTGAYTGALNSTSVQVAGPMGESASFYPGLRIAAGANGGVSWTIGSQTGTVPAGQSQVVYAPPGSSIALQASPSSFLYSFSGWTQGTNGTAVQKSISLSSPTEVTASFSVNLLAVGGIGAAAMILAAVAVVGLRRRGAQPKDPEAVT